MKHKVKILPALVCCLVAACILLSCTTVTTSESDTAATERPPEYFTLNPSVNVIRPSDEYTPELAEAFSILKNASVSIIGQEISVHEDWYRGELVRNEFEILLGRTNRPESETAYAALAYYDYTYEIISPGCVVVCGGSDEATLLAAKKFLADCYGYAADSSSGEIQDIPVGTVYVYKHEYPLQSLQLCGKDISSFSLVHPAKKVYRESAEILQKHISKITGVKLPLVPLEEYTGGNTLFIGCADADGSHLYTAYAPYNYIVKQEQENASCHVIIDSTADIQKVIESFWETFFGDIPEKGSYSVSIPSEPSILNICPDALNGLVLTDTTTEIIADGLTYTQHVYKGAAAEPVIAYVMEADLGKVDILNATPGYGNEIHNVKATTLQAIQAVSENGYQVLAGVNADFFRINSDYSPQGLCIKEGRVLSNAESDWFGITKDGKAVIGNASQYTSTYKDMLKEAVGGRNIILRDGFFYSIGDGTEFGNTRHPRTAVGIKPNGNLLFVVVDGRQSSLSNGASLADLAQIFLDLGAIDAINLDGGGSSSILTVSSSGDSFTTRNSPSDGKLRSVYNSLVIVQKKKQSVS